MAISSVALTQPVTPAVTQTAATDNIKTDTSFSTMLKDAINEVNDTQATSDVYTNKLVNGQDVELHDVMIAAQKANVTLNTALSIRNKAVEAYQEVMRMSV
ncbi:flagellar hook-basal body protein FliE [Kurthia sp. 3B1D]|uniref:Flagellar hook-basal body complex protein FliE n=2 Tax=Kurthia TaxID=1649 RepID=A0A433RT68_9BACL|nr:MULTISPECIES: flagellar hook-basal body complex protein FliE [unclassified Kurthia]RUS55352.1 flagellar hook-basal body protein FliE [Kurthia sp. 3B1D]